MFYLKFMERTDPWCSCGVLESGLSINLVLLGREQFQEVKLQT